MTEADFYKAIGFFRASGLSEAQAYHRAEEAMIKEEAMTPNEWNLQNMLEEALWSYAEGTKTTIKVRTYEDAGILTRDKGLIVEVEGSRFQLTIVKA